MTTVYVVPLGGALFDWPYPGPDPSPAARVFQLRKEPSHQPAHTPAIAAGCQLNAAQNVICEYGATQSTWIFFYVFAVVSCVMASNCTKKRGKPK